MVGIDSLPEFKSITGNKVRYASELNNEKLANYIFYEDDSVAKAGLREVVQDGV